MRYGPTDEHGPPHPGCHHDCGPFRAGCVQDLDEARRRESSSRELGGRQFGDARIGTGDLSGIRSRASVRSGLLGCGPSLSRVVLGAPARDSFGHFTGPQAPVTVPRPYPDPDTGERDREGQLLAVRDEFSGPAQRLAEAASRDQSA